jgi:diguanylate cyclase (GGDEF)-like protein
LHSVSRRIAGAAMPWPSTTQLKSARQIVDENVVRIGSQWGRSKGPLTSARFDPMSGTWTMIALDVAWVVILTAVCGWIAVSVWSGWAAISAYAALATAALFLLTALPLRHFLIAQRQIATERERLLSEESERRLFESQVIRALDMAQDRDGALDVAVGALELVVAGAHSEILLADSSRAHLASRSRSDGLATVDSCAVATPRGCPAVRTGHALRFDNSDALDACPFLKSRKDRCGSALCVPVSVMGSTTGVIHLTRREHLPFTQGDATLVSGVAQQFGSRVGLLTAMAQSELQASTDPLTGLLNRRSLENSVRALTSEATPFAVVLADLDHFKILNDTFGHDVGDRALRVFSRVLQAAVRDGDLVCRYGGEEFLMVMPRTNAVDAVEVLDRLRLELSASFADGRTPPFTVSAGVTDTTQGDDLAELISLADRALLQAKSDGRNRTVTCAGLPQHSLSS